MHRYLTILGEKKNIPPYPHHKDYVYRAYQFFSAKSFWTLVVINGVSQALLQWYRRLRYRYAIPLNLLIDPTSACNLRCTGCWASDYDKKRELSYEKLDEIITDARKLGVNSIVMSGGEPMMRKNDIVRLAGKHNRMPFAMFTNGTLIDSDFAGQMARLGNLNAFISIEGFREMNDFRRGTGTFDRVVRAMEVLRSNDIGFGFSVCYHSQNYKEVTGDAFLDFLREKGAWIGWMFNYMPVGSDADPSLCCNAQQRAYVNEKLEAYSARHRFMIIDFANMGHKAMGCVGAGIGFVHITSGGDVEPCAFNHYSDVNIHDKPLPEALASPFFRKFRKLMPFSGNVMRPCPVMDVPEALLQITQIPGVHSTHLGHPESPDEIVAKTRRVADEWKPVADDLFSRVPAREKRKIRLFLKFLLSQDAARKVPD